MQFVGIDYSTESDIKIINKPSVSMQKILEKQVVKLALWQIHLQFAIFAPIGGGSCDRM